MTLTDEDGDELRDILITAKEHGWANVTFSRGMIDRMLDREPPMINQIEARLEAVAKRLEEVCDKSALGAWNELERLRKDFSQETERAEKAEKEYESDRCMLRNAYGDVVATHRDRAEKAEAELDRLKAVLKRYEAKAECWPQPAPSCNPSWPS